MLAQDLLVIVRTVLAATVCMMDAALRWCPEGNGHIQCPDRQVAFHPVLTAQPMTHPECRSRITARYSQPSRVQT